MQLDDRLIGVLAIIGGIAVIASLLGITIGAIPGLTAVMGVALLIPITFFMDPVPAISAIAAMAIFAGDIPGALLRIPGTPASADYVEDAHTLSLQGRPERALGLSMASACFGGVIGVTLLMVAAPLLARFATNFSSVEYFWLAFLGLSCAAIISTGSPLKGSRRSASTRSRASRASPSARSNSWAASASSRR